MKTKILTILLLAASVVWGNERITCANLKEANEIVGVGDTVFIGKDSIYIGKYRSVYIHNEKLNWDWMDNIKWITLEYELVDTSSHVKWRH